MIFFLDDKILFSRTVCWEKKGCILHPIKTTSIKYSVHLFILSCIYVWPYTLSNTNSIWFCRNSFGFSGLKIKTCEKVKPLKIYFLQTSLNLISDKYMHISLTLLNHHEGKIHLHMILKSIPLNIHFISSASSTEAQHCPHIVRLIQSLK